jgi:squalene-hopene/tetraprenyl-beta-curcumene cyclase
MKQVMAVLAVVTPVSVLIGCARDEEPKRGNLPGIKGREVRAKQADTMAGSVKPNSEVFKKLFSSSATEPIAEKLSITKAADYLDSVGITWVSKLNCAACHTGYFTLMAGPSLRKQASAEGDQLRKYFEGRVANWDSGKDSDKPGQGTTAVTPLPTEGVTEVLATATALAFHDAQTTGKLHPLTKAALDRVWTLQGANGAWTWNKTQLAPLEFDDYFGAVFAAIGVGEAPGDYKSDKKAKDGMDKLRGFFKKTPAPNLHHKMWLLWAAQKNDGLMSPEEQDKTIKALLSLQRPDGGWSLKAIWNQSGDKPGPTEAESDGYGTGLALYVLHKVGKRSAESTVKKALSWLSTHQRQSGRWFTGSINGVQTNLITNAGTSLCGMALSAWGNGPE